MSDYEKTIAHWRVQELLRFRDMVADHPIMSVSIQKQLDDVCKELGIAVPLKP